MRLRRYCEYNGSVQTPSPKEHAISLSPLVEGQILAALQLEDRADAQLLDFQRYIKLHALESFDHFIRVDEEWLKSPVTQDVMQHNAANTSMWHPYLLHAILAISSSHLAFHKPQVRITKISSFRIPFFIRDMR